MSKLVVCVCVCVCVRVCVRVCVCVSKFGVPCPSWKTIFLVFVPRLPSKRTGAGDGADKKNPLDFYLEELGRRLPTFSVEVVQLTSHPLPESRDRVWILGSRNKHWPAADWAAAVSKCNIQSKAILEPHHVRTIFEGDTEDSKTGSRVLKQDAKKPWALEAEYAKYFGQAVESAVKAGRLPADFVAPSTRYSAGGFTELSTPFHKAQADVYDFILKQADGECSGHPDFFALADLSQSANRGHVSVNGLVGTLTTSTRLWSFQHGRFLSAKGHLRILGWDSSNVDVRGLSERDLYDLTGNAMSLAQLAKVIYPLVRHFGFTS